MNNFAASRQDFCELPDDQMFGQHVVESQDFGREMKSLASFCQIFSPINWMPGKSWSNFQHFVKDSAAINMGVKESTSDVCLSFRAA